jgi:hypothetical protein
VIGHGISMPRPNCAALQAQVGIDRNRGAGNWKVLDGAQRVDTVVGFYGNFEIAEQIVLDAMLGSCHIAAPVMRRHVGRAWRALALSTYRP